MSNLVGNPEDRFSHDEAHIFLSVPFFVSVSCPALNPPPSGRVEITSNGTISVADYSCSPGYILIGVGQRTCNTDRTWTTAEPTCSKSSQFNRSPDSLIFEQHHEKIFGVSDQVLNKPGCTAREDG